MSTVVSSAPAVGPARTTTTSRIDSIDILRGLVMVIMALDHTRDYFTYLQFAPEDLAKTWYALFFTRWITHFCAPLFFFLAGTGAYFYGRRRTPTQLSRFLWTRGLWLIVVEFTIVGFAWSFIPGFGFFGVIWALGASMVIMAAAVRMPLRWLAALSIIMIAGHNLLDGIQPARFGSLAWVWTILHVRGGMVLPFGIHNFVLFQIIPWVAVMGAGYAFGAVFALPPERRQKITARIGLVLVAAFILLRATNVYGNPPVGRGVSQGDWHVQPTMEKTVILFLDVEKYPPSLQFLLMTMGPSLLVLAWLDKRIMSGTKASPSSPSWLASAMLVYGRVPMFYYVLHLYLIHLLAVAMALAFHQPVSWLFHGAFFFGAPDGYGHGLPFIYLMWFSAVAMLYIPCLWWMRLKQRRRDWWLSYL